LEPQKKNGTEYFSCLKFECYWFVNFEYYASRRLSGFLLTTRAHLWGAAKATVTVTECQWCQWPGPITEYTLMIFFKKFKGEHDVGRTLAGVSSLSF
jgi:hypothetical protein